MESGVLLERKAGGLCEEFYKQMQNYFLFYPTKLLTLLISHSVFINYGTFEKKNGNPQALEQCTGGPSLR